MAVRAGLALAVLVLLAGCGGGHPASAPAPTAQATGGSATPSPSTSADTVASLGSGRGAGQDRRGDHRHRGDSRFRRGCDQGSRRLRRTRGVGHRRGALPSDPAGPGTAALGSRARRVQGSCGGVPRRHRSEQAGSAQEDVGGPRHGNDRTRGCDEESFGSPDPGGLCSPGRVGGRVEREEQRCALR